MTLLLLAFRCLEVKYNFKLFDRDWISPHLSNLSYHVCISFEIQTLHLSPVSMELTQLRQVVTEVRLNSVNLTTSPVIEREIPVAQSVDRPSKVQAGTTLLKWVRITPRDMSSL